LAILYISLSVFIVYFNLYIFRGYFYVLSKGTNVPLGTLLVKGVVGDISPTEGVVGDISPTYEGTSYEYNPPNQLFSDT